MEHSNVFSFSQASRLIKCYASRRMSAGIPGTSNPQAELGTSAHEMGEFCLRFGFDPENTIGMTFGKHYRPDGSLFEGTVADEYMVDAVRIYTGFVRSLVVKTNGKLMLEQRVAMTSLGRDDVFGTSDCIIIAGNTLYIIDYKHGYNVVDVKDNLQLIAYAIATLDTFNLWGAVSQVVTTIVQPRKSHIDGPIRQWSYSVADLRYKWWQVYYDAVKGGEDPNSVPVAGAHCKYCPTRGRCRARVQYMLDQVFWDKPFDTMTNQEIEILYEEIGHIKTNIEAIEKRALEIGRQGYRFENFKLVDSITRAHCEDEKGLVDAAKKEGVSVDRLYDQRLKSMTNIKKVLPWQIVNQYFKKPPASSTLAPMNDNRPAKSMLNIDTSGFTAVSGDVSGSTPVK